jgi:hypothetical protein
MNIPAALAVAVATSFFSAANVDAQGQSSPAAPVGRFDFRPFLRYHPLELSQLLGKHFSEVVPGVDWEGMPSPEEYKNPSIKYAVFVRDADLHDYMKTWDFMTGEYCVSSYSMFIIYFNKGFVFKVELRYMPDSYTGLIKSTDPRICLDETPIFTMIANKLGGTKISHPGYDEVTQYKSTYITTLSTRGHNADLSWDLRGGPRPNS